MQKVLSRHEWSGLWDRLKNSKLSSDLNAYAEFVNSEKAQWRQRYPGVEFNNGRYVVHLETALEHGDCVPAEYLQTVCESEIAFDFYEFPNLCNRCGFSKYILRIAEFNQRMAAIS